MPSTSRVPPRFFVLALACFVAVASLLVARSARAMPPSTVLPAGFSMMTLGENVEVAEDPSGAATLDDAVHERLAERFVRNGGSIVYRGASQSAFWLRFHVVNGSGAAMPLLLEVKNPFTDVSLFVQRRHGGVEEPFRAERVRADAPFAERAIHYHHPLLEVPLGAGEEMDVYLRLAAPLASFPLRIWTPETFAVASREHYLVTGSAAGVLFAMIVHSLFMFASVRLASYALYALFISIFAVLQLSVDGYLFQFVWPDWPIWHARSVNVLVFVAVASYVAFSREFLETRKYVRKVDPYLRVVEWTFTALALVALLHPRSPIYPLVVLANTGQLFVVVATAVVAVYALKAGSAAAPFSLAALFCLFCGLFTFNAHMWGYIPTRFFSVYSLQLGAVSEAFCFSWGLARSYHHLTRELESRIFALEKREREIFSLNAELRHQVAERSRQLSEALARIEGSDAGMDLEPGTVLAGRYRVVRPSGEGAMGTVYAVERVSDARPFALKVLTNVGGPQALARFAREAEIAATVDHENVVPVLDVAVADEGFLFIVMELVPGCSLDMLTVEKRPLSWTLDVLAQVARGLGAIHAHGVIHRDLKPANILVDESSGARPIAKITDFGIATAACTKAEGGRPIDPLARTLTPSIAPVSEPEVARPPVSTRRDVTSGTRNRSTPGAGANLTEAGALIGTPNYMAPELARGAGQASPAADVFSLGCIAYEMLTGERAFRDAPVLARLRGATPMPAPRVAQKCPHVPLALAELVDRALGKDPTARPTPDELAAAFERAQVETRSATAYVASAP